MNAYENMRAVTPGDVVYSYHDGVLAAVGIATSTAYDCIAPEEFAEDRSRWDWEGWKVDVHFSRLNSRVSPKAHLNLIRPYLPEKYSPLQKNGNGVMHYLFEISASLAEILAGLVGPPARELIHGARAELVKGNSALPTSSAPIIEWEDHLQQQILSNPNLGPTERKALVNARIGQGRFKENVRAIESACRLTGVRNDSHLIASHIKPWRHSGNDERLDGENGLLLTPSMDHLFDKGHITFENNGSLIISPSADRDSLKRMGIANESSISIVEPFSRGQQKHLDFHREKIFVSRGF